ncbi:hypothetical protein ACODNH_23600 (plasmid) [Haloarcula sp. NS06]
MSDGEDIEDEDEPDNVDAETEPLLEGHIECLAENGDEDDNIYQGSEHD